MILKSLKVGRVSDTVWLVFEDGRRLPFNLDLAVGLHLKAGQDIVNMADIEAQSLTHLLVNYSLNQVAISPKVEGLLLPKLNQKARFYIRKYLLGVDPVTSISQAVDYLHSRHLLEESQFVSYFLRRHSHRSSLYIRQYLRHLGISSVLLDNFVVDDSGAINKLIIRKIPRDYFNLDINTRQKLLFSIVRKGFPYHKVKTMIDEYLENR